MIRHPKQQPDINCWDNYSSRCCTNVYYYRGRSVLGLALCVWHVLRFTHGNIGKRRKEEEVRLRCTFSPHAVSYSITRTALIPASAALRRDSPLNASRSRGAPNVRRKAREHWSKLGQEHRRTSACSPILSPEAVYWKTEDKRHK